jgi:hypothetical protein
MFFLDEIFANVCTFYLLLASHVFVHGYNAEQLGFVAQLVHVMINYICMSKPGTIIIRSINRAFVDRLI